MIDADFSSKALPEIKLLDLRFKFAEKNTIEKFFWDILSAG